MALITRGGKGAPLTIAEMDGNFTYLESMIGGGTGSTGSVVTAAPIDIVYADLYELITTETLEPGAWYRLTDYKSVNFINGVHLANDHFVGQSIQPMDPNFDPYQVHVGAEEVLILHAISNYELSTIAYSETFQGDILEYDAFTNKIGVGVDISNGNDISGGASPSIIISGFDLQWDGTNVYFNMPVDAPALFGHYLYLYAEFFDGNDYYYQDGTFEPLTPGISVCQYPYTSDDPEFGYGKAMTRLKVAADGIKVILLDLVEADFTNYQVDSLEVETVKAIADSYGCVTRRKDTYRNIDIPFDFRYHVYRRFEVDIQPPFGNLKYAAIGGWFNGQQTTGNYIDYKAINADGYDCYNVFIGGFGGPDEYAWYRGTCYNNVMDRNVYEVYIDGIFTDNTILGGMQSSRFYSNFSNNFSGNNQIYGNVVSRGFSGNIISIGGSFNSNKLVDFSYNKCYGPFTDNKIDLANSNTFADSSSNNKINYMSGNTIGSNFANNIADNMSDNTIGTSFNTNKIDGIFAANTIGNNFFNNNIMVPGISGINFGSATHVYAQYTTTIFENSAFAFRLSYINGSDTLTVVAPNA